MAIQRIKLHYAGQDDPYCCENEEFMAAISASAVSQFDPDRLSSVEVDFLLHDKKSCDILISFINAIKPLFNE